MIPPKDVKWLYITFKGHTYIYRLTYEQIPKLREVLEQHITNPDFLLPEVQTRFLIDQLKENTDVLFNPEQ